MKIIVKNYIEGRVPEEKRNSYDYNLLKAADITEGSDCVTLDWNYLKWYEGIQGYEDVDAIMYSLDMLGEKDIDYQYMRIGEEIDDIDERWSINNGSFDSFYISRNFEG